MKKVIFSLIAVFGLSLAVNAYSYDTNLPLPGSSIADQKLQQESLFTVYMFAHRVATPDCKDFAIVDTKVSSEKVDNKWQEVWTIKACTKNVLIPINFEAKADGTNFAIDPINVKVRQIAE